eukprot:GHRR01027262.1.p1 GENE.GHRR01027262.1~~GHRR01027262.1.p1  ORF type:complete len:104 (+),score=0.59 GHRR01027262.1:914-1225(+)
MSIGLNPLSATHPNICVQPPFSLLLGLTGTYAYLYTYGGPVSIIWGWLLVCSFNFLLGLLLAEICSAYPTSWGVYFWSHRLGGEGGWGPAAFAVEVGPSCHTV